MLNGFDETKVAICPAAKCKLLYILQQIVERPHIGDLNALFGMHQQPFFFELFEQADDGLARGTDQLRQVFLGEIGGQMVTASRDAFFRYHALQQQQQTGTRIFEEHVAVAVLDFLLAETHEFDVVERKVGFAQHHLLQPFTKKGADDGLIRHHFHKLGAALCMIEVEFAK